MGRYTIGKRRFSWESGGGRSAARPGSADPLAGLLVVLALSYFFMKPIFWILLGLLSFIGACLLVVGVISAGEWAHRKGWFRWFRLRSD